MNPRMLTRLQIGVLTLIATGFSANLMPHAAATESDDEFESADVLPGNIVQRKLTMASGDPETLNDILEQLIGSWHQSPGNFSEEGKAWMLENNISGFYDTFSWGTNKAWIDFGDYRIVNGEAEKTGVGMISWHTGYKHLRFRESGARGGFVDGMLEIKDDNTIIRHFEFFAPDGAVSYHSDTWSFDPRNPECFSWQSTGYEGGVPKAYPARKFCKSEQTAD